MPQCILVRHGKRIIRTGERSGDGPLVLEGRAGVHNTAHVVVRELKEKGIARVDLAVISGSIRCAETFGILWGVFLEEGIPIVENDMEKAYFSTREEDLLWREFYEHEGELFAQAQEMFGEKEAARQHALYLIFPCVTRTLHRIYTALDAGAQTILVCTHGPHDAFIADELTQQAHEGLGQGKARIISF